MTKGCNLHWTQIYFFPTAEFSFYQSVLQEIKIYVKKKCFLKKALNCAWKGKWAKCLQSSTCNLSNNSMSQNGCSQAPLTLTQHNHLLLFVTLPHNSPAQPDIAASAAWCWWHFCLKISNISVLLNTPSSPYTFQRLHKTCGLFISSYAAFCYYEWTWLRVERWSQLGAFSGVCLLD